jgi:ABC-type lipoprotein export system ATPase subunit
MFNRLFKRNTDQTNGGYRHGNTHLIELRNVVKTYQSAAGTFTALKGVDLRVDRGEFVAVIGKSGSGKSTLINMITGIDRPSSGEVYVGDTAVHKLNEGQMAVWRGKDLGIIFQFFQLLPTLSVIENVMLPMDFCNMYTPRERRERAMYLLGQVDMVENAHKLPSAISGGQQQRVAIARALANDPPVLVADEPTGNLDSKTAGQVFKLFEELVAQGKTILMVTHDTDLAKRATRAVIVSDGEVINQYVVQALPGLTVDQLAWVTRELEPCQFHPGETIITQGEMADRFYIITSGEVEIEIHHPDGQEIIVDRLSQGKYFGEMGLVRSGARTATVRAAPETQVEVATLDREDFSRLMATSEETKAEMGRITDERFRSIAAFSNQQS